MRSQNEAAAAERRRGGEGEEALSAVGFDVDAGGRRDGRRFSAAAVAVVLLALKEVEMEHSVVRVRRVDPPAAGDSLADDDVGGARRVTVIRSGGKVSVPLELRDGKTADGGDSEPEAAAIAAYEAHKVWLRTPPRLRDQARVPAPRDPDYITMASPYAKRNYAPGLANIGSKVTTPLVSGAAYVRGDAAPAGDLAALKRQADEAWEARNQQLRDAWKKRG